MKKIFVSAFLAMGLTSCEEITDAINSIKVPAEAKPSKSFTLDKFTAEPNAADARRFATSQSDAPFASIEFFGDGHYLINDGKTSRATATELYGKYEVDANLHYTLANGDVIDASSLDGSHGTVTYTPMNGESVAVSIAADAPLTSDASKTICRTWRLDTSKYWLSLKGITALYRGYHLENGALTHEDNKVADFIGDIYDDELITLDRWPELITISPFGTYYVQFASGKPLTQEWEWGNEATGILKTQSDAQFSITDFLKNKNVTIRFVDGTLRLFTEYDIQTTRVLNVNAFLPAYK